MLCDALRIPYTDGGLRDQPSWFVDTYKYYLTGKVRAEKAKAEKKS